MTPFCLKSHKLEKVYQSICNCIQVSMLICVYLETNTFIPVAMKSLIITNRVQLGDRDILSIPIDIT